jgi:hypothetical protein
MPRRARVSGALHVPEQGFSRLTTMRAVPAARGGGTGRAGPSGALGRLFRRTLARSLLGRPFHRAPGPPVGQ